MQLSFYVSPYLPADRAFVGSAAVQTPISLGPLRINTKTLTNVFFVDGQSGIDVTSGAGTLEISVGYPGQAGTPPFYSTTFIAASMNGQKGWQGYVDLTFANFALMQDTSRPVMAVLEINAIDTNGARAMVARQSIEILPGVAGATVVPSTPSPPPSPSSFVGSVNIGNGASGGTITGLAIPSTPIWVKYLNVAIPNGGVTINAYVVIGTLTTDGFQYTLSGITNMAGYVLNYEISY